LARSILLKGSIPLVVLAFVVAACGSEVRDVTGGERIGTGASADSTGCATGALLQGVDTSSGQGTVTWSSAKTAGVDWVIMKATQGNYDDDSAFPKNWGPAKTAGVVRGAYHFFDPTIDGPTQASYFLAAVGPLDAEDLSPVLDVECPTGPTDDCLGFSGGTGVTTAATFRTNLLGFLNTVEAATGRKPIIYTYVDFFAGTGAAGTGTNVDTTGLDAYPLWIADYSPGTCGDGGDGKSYTAPSPWSQAAAWQYDDNGTFSGISGEVDVDWMVGPIDELLGWPGPKRSSRADVNGDGLADACGRDPTGVVCSLAQSGGTFGSPFSGPAWADASGWQPAAYASTVQFADVNADGKADACARAAAGIVCALSTGTGFETEFTGPAWSDTAGWNAPAYYATIQLADVNGDGKADACGRGPAGITCAPSKGTSFGAELSGPAWSDATGWNTPNRYRTIRFPDINGDGKADVCGRSSDGIHCALSAGTGFGTDILGPGWSDATGWSLAAYASTIQFPDVNGDGEADVCARAGAGITCALSNGNGFGTPFAGPAWSDTAGWNAPAYYATIAFLDLNGDGKADVCGRSPTGMTCALSTGTGFGTPFDGPAWTDATGWNQPHYYGTIGTGDVTGDGMDDLCARSATGVVCYPSTGTGFGAEITGPPWSDAVWGVAPYWATTSIVGLALHGAASDGGVGDGGTLVPEEGGSPTVPDGSVSVTVSAAASGGCSCRAGRESGGGGGAGVAALGIALAFAQRRARARSARERAIDPSDGRLLYVRGNGSRVAPRGFDPSTSFAYSAPPVETVNGPPSSSVTR
jgi:GH25 family lysozyme M1 (1,4-beta-N-acetylmuramidase)